VNVRRASAGDVAALAGLLGELGYPVEAARLRERMARLPESTTLFVTDDVSAMAALDIRQGIQHDAPRAQIVALVVRSDARGRGVARRLVEVVEDAARAAGCTQLTVISGDHRPDAHAAYRALGFADTGVRFRKDLD
jgi:GNAT superfamily N-acetyltransferase